MPNLRLKQFRRTGLVIAVLTIGAVTNAEYPTWETTGTFIKAGSRSNKDIYPIVELQFINDQSQRPRDVIPKLPVTYTIISEHLSRSTLMQNGSIKRNVSLPVSYAGDGTTGTIEWQERK